MIFQLLFFPPPVFLWLSSSDAPNKVVACSADCSSPLVTSMLQSAQTSCLCFLGGTEQQTELSPGVEAVRWAGYDLLLRWSAALVPDVSEFAKQRLIRGWLRKAEQDLSWPLLWLFSFSKGFLFNWSWRIGARVYSLLFGGNVKASSLPCPLVPKWNISCRQTAGGEVLKRWLFAFVNRFCRHLVLKLGKYQIWHYHQTCK